MEYKKEPTETKRAVIYLRVSTEEQVDNFSLGTQEEMCVKGAERRGIEVVKIFKEEGRSAKNIIGRPVLIELLAFCKKNKKTINAVIVYRLDRISRQTQDYLAIRKKLADSGIELISISEPTGNSPTEKLVETILAGFAQLDNDVRSERTKNGMRTRFKSGLMSGKPPLGYILNNGYAVKDPNTWDSVKKAWDLMATGTKSLSEMAAIMNGWGLRKIVGGKEYALRPQTANRIFRSKFYIGILTSDYYPDEARGQHVPMITEQQFYKVQAILDGRNVNKIPLAKRNSENPEFPLRRVVRCARCGMGLTAAWSKGRHAKYAYYRCSAKCTNSSIKVETLERTIMDLLKQITPKKECLQLFLTFLYKTYYERLSRLQKTKNEADAEIARVQEMRRLLVEKNLSGVYSDEIFKEQNTILEEKMIRAQVVKDDGLIDKYNIDALTAFVKTLLADLGETYKRSTISQVRVLLGSIFPTGLAWNYEGTLNHTISPIYQYILAMDSDAIPFGTREGIRTPDSRAENPMSWAARRRGPLACHSISWAADFTKL